MNNGPVLLYDGLCALCNGWVKFILAHDNSREMKFAPLQGSYSSDVVARHPSLRDIDSIVLITPSGEGEHVAIRSEAVLRIASYLGGPWRLVGVMRLVPRSVRDWGYDLVAKSRYALFGKHNSCPIPEPDVRHRFLP